MNIHVRFRQGLDAYPKGSSHYLPDELADHYIRAGVAELVDVVPRPALEPEAKSEPAKAERESSEAGGDKPKADDDEPKKTTGSKRRSKS